MLEVPRSRNDSPAAGNIGSLAGAWVARVMGCVIVEATVAGISVQSGDGSCSSFGGKKGQR
ncbi:hypothetical protein J6590_053991 [Homalodisca vitripennis]|nr:hypothetical protein J6590_053991 [Homalodisca vitripennis]